MSSRQNGAALIVVLLILVSMLLMGIALMRSTDLASLITGNMASKQAASYGGDIGLVAAETALAGFSANPGTNAAGYSNIALVSDSYGIPTATGTSTWAPATAISLGNGLSYKYLIERMCTDTAGTNCSTTKGASGGEVATGGSARVDAAANAGGGTPATMYRATVIITGPKNLTTYVQALYSR